MIRNYLHILIFFIILSGCMTVNEDPNILNTEPYNKVEYISEPEKDYETVEVIQITTRGLLANILNTIPLLYKKALEYSKQKLIRIGNIRLSSFIRLENFQVPYQDCRSVPRSVSVPTTSCYSGNCSTIYSYQTRYVQDCSTKYRTEIRNVLYQIGAADILKKKRDK